MTSTKFGILGHLLPPVTVPSTWNNLSVLLSSFGPSLSCPSADFLCKWPPVLSLPLIGPLPNRMGTAPEREGPPLSLRLSNRAGAEAAV